MSKRQKIVITSIVAAGLILLTMLTTTAPGILEVLLVSLIVYGLSAWALQPDLAGQEYLTLLALPTLLTIGTLLTSERPNLPIPWAYFIPPIFGAGLYVTLLVENIFNVAVERSIPLLRAARTVGYLLTLGSVFLIASLIFALHLPSYINFLTLFVVGGTAVGQALWQVQLAQTVRSKLLLASLVSGLVVGEIALVISFWPTHPLVSGLVIMTVTYSLIGMIQHDWQENMNRRAILEYILVGTIVFLLLIFTTSWTG